MADNKISPEERLFKVIQEGKNSPPGNKSGRRGIPRMGIKQFLGGLMPRAAVAGAPRTTSVVFPVKFSDINPTAVNKVLIVILVILAVSIVNYAVRARPNVAKISEAISKMPAPAVKKKKEIEAFKPASIYIDEIRKRNIFVPYAAKEEKPVIAAPREEEKAQETLKKIAASIKLQGISWGKNPKAIIKHVGEDKMYFLKEGQMLGATGVELKEIHKNKVVISYKGEEMELL